MSNYSNIDFHWMFIIHRLYQLFEQHSDNFTVQGKPSQDYFSLSFKKERMWFLRLENKKQPSIQQWYPFMMEKRKEQQSWRLHHSWEPHQGAQPVALTGLSDPSAYDTCHRHIFKPPHSIGQCRDPKSKSKSNSENSQQLEECLEEH